MMRMKCRQQRPAKLLRRETEARIVREAQQKEKVKERDKQKTGRPAIHPQRRGKEAFERNV